MLIMHPVRQIFKFTNCFTILISEDKYNYRLTNLQVMAAISIKNRRTNTSAKPWHIALTSCYRFKSVQPEKTAVQTYIGQIMKKATCNNPYSECNQCKRLNLCWTTKSQEATGQTAWRILRIIYANCVT